MSAHTTSSHVVYLPKTMTYGNVSVQRPTDRKLGTSRPSGLEAVVAKAFRFLVSIPRRQAVMNELSRLTDRELSDIGLSRSEISSVFSRAR